MSIMLPGELVEVMDFLGFQWPHADEDKIFECGQAWKDYAGDVERVIADADRVCREAVERNRGEAITAFEGHWRELGGQGDLRRAADAAGIVSDALEAFGYAVIAMKTATITQLGIAAAAIIASVASAIFTAGLSTLAGAAAVQAARIAIREIIQELIEKLVKNIIPKLRHEAGEIFEQMIKRLRRYLDELVTKLNQMRRRGGGGGRTPRRHDRDGDGDRTPDNARDKSSLSSSDRRSVESYEKLIAEHKAKLDAYRANPDKFDHKGILKNAPSDEVRQRIIDGRIRHLEKEIQAFQDNIEKIFKGPR